MKIQVQTSLIHRKDKTVSFVTGNQTFNKELITEMEKETFEILTLKDPSLSIVGKQEPKVETKEETQKKGEIDEELNLSKMTLKQLQEVATEAEFPIGEWKNLTKAQIVDYITSKMV